MTTKGEVDKSPFLIVKNQQNNDVKLVVSPSNFQVGLTNSPASLTSTGQATFQQGLTSNGLAVFNQGLQGSITNLPDGTSYLVAGSNITITSASNGQITISSTAGGAGTGDVVGPASATDNAIARFNETTGKLLQNSVATVADTTGNITTYDAEVGSLSGFAGTYAMFGHKNQTSLGGYAIVQKNDGETWLNAPTDKYVRFTTDGNPLSDGYIGFSTFFDRTVINLQGRSLKPATVTLGSTSGTSTTTIQAGSSGLSIQAGNLDVVTPNGDIYIGTQDTYSSRTIKIGSDGDGTATKAQLIELGTKNTSGYNRVRICDGPSSNGHEVDIISHAFGATQPYAYSLVNIGTINALTYINVGGTNTTGGGINTSAVKKITIGSEYSDSYVKIRNGTGCITMQDQPCFLAYVSTGQSIANTGAFDIQFNSERFDVQSNYDSSTNFRFTAPVTGKYIFNVSIRIDDIDTAANYYYLSLVTSNATYQMSVIDPNFSADLDYYWMCGSAVVDMDVGDTAKVQLRQSGGTNNQSTIVDNTTAGQVCSYFSGWLLG